MITYILFRIGIGLFRIMPFWLLYVLSDILYYILYYIVGYRKKVVRGNLQTAYGATHTPAQIKTFEKEFYSHLCDILLEGIKGIVTPRAELEKRYKVVNPDLYDTYYERGQSAIFTSSHTSNWEWGISTLCHYLKHEIFIIYKELKNPRINHYLRHRVNDSVMCGMKDTSKGFKAQIAKNVPTLFILAADQNPANRQQAHWVNFFGKETAAIHGIAKYAQYYNFPVFYFGTKRVKRGYYETTLDILIEDPSKFTPEEITQIYMSKVEEHIRQDPSQWLWSHKRWKYTKADV